MQRNRILLRCKSLLNISILSSWRLRRTHNSLESSLRSEKQFRMHAPFPGCIFILMYFAEYSATIMAATIVWNKFCLKTLLGAILDWDQTIVFHKDLIILLKVPVLAGKQLLNEFLCPGCTSRHCWVPTSVSCSRACQTCPWYSTDRFVFTHVSSV